ncbi:MAG: aminotransferase class V-fold PLP-dependent enzyme [Acetivibrionales bacterium]|jgi:cysteine desulfurase/selenocysteine lyase
MIYLDNAATSFPKPEIVYNEIEKCMRVYCANPGRGGHYMSIKSGEAVMEARKVISNFFNISNPLRLSFTKNATEALNIAIKGCLKPGNHVITTSMEHNSVIRPLKTLEKKGKIELTVIQGNKYGGIDTNDVKKQIRQNTALIVTTLSSNVNGIVLPINEIGELSKDNGITYLVDASQGAGILDIDVRKMNIDMLAFPGHKSLLGPQGTGGLYVKESIELDTLMEGGTGSNSNNLYQPGFMPDYLESGTLNTPGIIGLAYGIRFINTIGIKNIAYLKELLLQRFFEGIREIKGVKVYSPQGKGENSGIVALNIGDMDSTEVSDILNNNYNIATRAGLHCAPLAHATLGTLDRGVVRFSIGCFNTIDDIDIAVNAVRDIAYGRV